MNQNKVYERPLCVLVPMDLHSVRVCCSEDVDFGSSTNVIIDKDAEESYEVERDEEDNLIFPKKAFEYRATVF